MFLARGRAMREEKALASVSTHFAEVTHPLRDVPVTGMASNGVTHAIWGVKHASALTSIEGGHYVGI